MEPNREIVEDLMRRYGYEQEAEIAYHLREARNRLFELLRVEAEAEPGGFWRLYEETFIQSNVLPHFTALSNLLATRVLARQFPEGWGFRPPAKSRARLSCSPICWKQFWEEACGWSCRASCW